MRIRLKNTLLIVFVIALYSRVEGQLNPASLKYYGEPAGSAVYDILPDRTGNIWIAGQNGLVQFNGYEFKRYYSDPNDSTSVGSILPYRLFEDRKGNIWIGSLGNLCRYHPGTKSFKSYPFIGLTDFPQNSQVGISLITADTNGRIYFGVTSFIGRIASHALLYYDEKDDVIRRFEGGGITEVQNIYSGTSDPSGNIWFISQNGFFRLDHSGTLHETPLPDGLTPGDNRSYFWMTGDKKGLIWLTSYQGEVTTLYAFDPVTGIYKSRKMNDIHGIPDSRFVINAITTDSLDNIWLGTNKGLVFYDRLKDKFEIFELKPERQLEHSEIFCLKFDSFGSLWYGTPLNGVVKYDTRTVLHSFISAGDDKNPLPLGWAYRLYESSDGKVWIATFGDNRSGINELNPETGTLIPHLFTNILPEHTGFSGFIEERPGEFLASSGWQFYIYYTRSNTIKQTFLEGFPDSVYVYNFYHDSHGNLWICTQNSLYWRPEGDNLLRHIDLGLIQGSNASSKEVVNVFEGKKHGLWILTNNGLFLYEYQTGKVSRHGYDRASGDIFSSQDINSFYEDNQGNCWVGTWQGGLSRYNPETGIIKTYTSANGLPSMSIQGILADEPNNALWISTFEGISRFSINEEEFINFSLEDGIQGLMYADGSYLKTSGGYFVFGGNNGITVFKPEDIEKNSLPPKIYITDFKVANKSLASGPNSILNDLPGQAKEVILKYKQNNISIDYVGIHYANPARNKFAYKLENYDDEWREVGNVRTAYFYNLPPGKYTFHVKAANSNGIWNEEGASLDFTITPPWSRTWLAYTFYGILLMIVIFFLDRYQRNRVLMKERMLVKEKELEHAREIEKAYEKLKSTQTQLLHAEKMASLGELTAGIAHEIQNPLNFVNNFAEVSAELIRELDGEMIKGNTEEVVAIAADVRQNLEKINYHGKRASGIVKGMLEHSRTSTGQKEPTDINVLADEYLRLAYHGLRAKDKSFNADFKTDFDETLPGINVIPQDMGRVLLNLVNNAFYAVSARAKEAEAGYVPKVLVSTRRIKDKVEIKVKDNGHGIPPGLLDKIFQPFFTTKPTGEGTGLGLSLSYDIVKAHGGELTVETKEGEGTTFIIVIPVNN